MHAKYRLHYALISILLGPSSEELAPAAPLGIDICYGWYCTLTRSALRVAGIVKRTVPLALS